MTIGDRLFNRAMNMVQEAVESGLLPALDGSVKCKDCDKPAVVYDHRDYRKPLMVEPVCKGCNSRRGPALPLLPPDEQQSYKLGWFEGYSGNGWSGMEGGEGYSPLQCICRISTSELEALTDRIQSSYDGMKTINMLSAKGMKQAKGGGYRAEFFKAHDPWRLT